MRASASSTRSIDIGKERWEKMEDENKQKKKKKKENSITKRKIEDILIRIKIFTLTRYPSYVTDKSLR